MTVAAMPPSAASSAKIRLNMPGLLQQMKRLQIVLCGQSTGGVSRRRRRFLIGKVLPLSIRRSSTRGMRCGEGKYASIRRVCASTNRHGPDTVSTWVMPLLSHPIDSGASVLIGHEPRQVAIRLTATAGKCHVSARAPNSVSAT